MRAERGRSRLNSLIQDEDDVAIAAITVAELLVGVELPDEARRPARKAFVDGVIASVPVEDYTLEVADAHARLLVHVRRAGRPRGARDLIVAATGAATGRTMLTSDGSAALDELPGVDAMAVRRMP